MKKLIKRLMMLMQVVRKHDGAPKVVFYHDIGIKYTPMGTPESIFWSHMAYLQKLKLRVEVEGSVLHSSTSPLNFDSHVVAFDDGFRGIWDARSRLKVEVDNGLQIIVFLAVDLVDKPNYLTWDEIRTLQNDYGFNFQCHTWSHQTLIGPINPDLPPPANADFRTDAWYHHELVDSKNELERQLNLSTSTSNLNHQPSSPCSTRSPRLKTIDALCFPVGNFSDDVLRRCREAGYKKVYASYPGNITDDYVQPRNLVQDFSLFDFKLTLHGGMMAFRNRYYNLHKIDA